MSGTPRQRDLPLKKELPSPRNPAAKPGDDKAGDGKPPPVPGKKEEKVQLPPLDVGTIVKGRWELYEQIGHGAFGEIYKAMDLNSKKKVAVKVERWETKKSVLHLEVAVLKKVQGSPYVARYVGCGRSEGFNFLVMELLGTNLSELRRNQPNQKFSLSTTCRLATQMLLAVRDLHEAGYLHRDIKPSNFGMGAKATPEQKQCFMFDFGLARKYRNTTGEMRPARANPGFRGTARYASINAHDSLELGRVDDLWCLFYLLVEFMVGALPWRKYKEKDEIGKWKKELTNARLVSSCPAEMLSMMNYLRKLETEDEPDYDHLKSLLDSIMEREGVRNSDQWDWEKTVAEALEESSSDGAADDSDEEEEGGAPLLNRNHNNVHPSVGPTTRAESRTAALPLLTSNGAVMTGHTANTVDRASPSSVAVVRAREKEAAERDRQRRRNHDLQEKEREREHARQRDRKPSVSAQSQSQGHNPSFIQVIDIKRAGSDVYGGDLEGTAAAAPGGDGHTQPQPVSPSSRQVPSRRMPSRNTKKVAAKSGSSLSPNPRSKDRGEHSGAEDSRQRSPQPAVRQRDRKRDETASVDRDRSRERRESKDEVVVRERAKERGRERELLKSGFDKAMGGSRRGSKNHAEASPPEAPRGGPSAALREIRSGGSASVLDSPTTGQVVYSSGLASPMSGLTSDTGRTPLMTRGRSASKKKAGHHVAVDVSGERAESYESNKQEGEEEDALPVLDAPAAPVEPYPSAGAGAGGAQFRSNRFSSRGANGTGSSKDLRAERDITVRQPSRNGIAGAVATASGSGSGGGGFAELAVPASTEARGSRAGSISNSDVGELRQELVKQNAMAAERIQELERQLQDLDASARGSTAT